MSPRGGPTPGNSRPGNRNAAKPPEARAVMRTLRLHPAALVHIALLREAWGLASDAGVIERALLLVASHAQQSGADSPPG